MATYRYVFLDIMTSQVIEEINLFGVYCLRQLNGPGQFNGSFTLDQSGKNNSDLMAATTPGRCWVVAERNGVPVYWGIIWSRTYQSQAKVVEIFAWGFEAYPQRQVILSNFNQTLPSTQLFTTLWTHMLSVSGRGIDVNIPSIIGGPTTTLTVLASDYETYGNKMDAIANGSSGFDWSINVSKANDNTYDKNLVIGYPTLGTQQNPATISFEYPGAITNYYATDSMASAGTHVFVIGAGEAGSMPVNITSQQQMIDLEGWPRWDIVSSHKDVSDQATINSLAAQEKINFKPPAPTYKLTVKGDQQPEFGSYGLGDACQLVITDARFPSPDGSTPGLVVPSRIIGWELRPSDSTQVEEVNVLLPGDTVNG